MVWDGLTLAGLSLKTKNTTECLQFIFCCSNVCYDIIKILDNQSYLLLSEDFAPVINHLTWRNRDTFDTNR